MKKISREYPKTQLAIYKIIDSNEEDLELILDADYIYRSGKNEGENIKYKTINDEAVSKFLIKYFKEIILKGVSNSYLKKMMEMFFTNYDVEIVGKNEKLYRCSCCGYFTLNNIGKYDICRLCYWEDDGVRSDEMNKYSHANKSTLKDYKNDFEKKLNSVEIIFDK